MDLTGFPCLTAWPDQCPCAQDPALGEGCPFAKPKVLHDSLYECDECGGPSPETSMQGCQFCDGQGDIVLRGQARIRTWRPTELNMEGSWSTQSSSGGSG